jgi:hypothetical protein
VVEVTRVRITAAGRQTLAGRGDNGALGAAYVRSTSDCCRTVAAPRTDAKCHKRSCPLPPSREVDVA